MKSELEIAANLAEFDTMFCPYGITVLNISLWRIVRSTVGRALRGLPLTGPAFSPTEIAFAGLRSLTKLRFPTSTWATYAVRSYSSALRVKAQDGFEDIYFEDLLRYVPNGLRMHSSNAVFYSRRQHGMQNESLDCTFIYLISTLLARARPIRSERQAFVKLSSLIENNLGLTTFTPATLERIFSNFWWEARIYEFLLNGGHVRTVIAADNGERALIAACLKLGIKFIELQHGVFNSTDPDCVPTIALNQASPESLLLPNAFAQFGSYWVHLHEKTAMGKLERLFPVGSTTIEKYRRIRNEQFQPDADCPRLLVTTQGLDREALIEFLSSFLYSYTGRCVLKIKLHPVFDRSVEVYSTALESDQRVEIISGEASQNTYDLISKSDLHISIASACHYDALGIGTPTAVLNLKGCDAVQDLVRKGDALYLNTPADLANIIAQRSWGKVDAATSGQYFKQDHLRNMLALLH